MVFTQGLRVRPRSTAFFATSAAPIITDGFEVLVHEVIAAIATMPWSISNDVPSESVTATGLRGRPEPAPTGSRGRPLVSSACSSPGAAAAGSLAGNDWAEASSTSLVSNSVWST